MLLHIGGDTVVRTGDIIGIFDMDTSTVGKATRDFLTRAEQHCSVCHELTDRRR